MLVRVDVDDFFRAVAAWADAGTQTLKASISASSRATFRGRINRTYPPIRQRLAGNSTVVVLWNRNSVATLFLPRNQNCNPTVPGSRNSTDFMGLTPILVLPDHGRIQDGCHHSCNRRAAPFGRKPPLTSQSDRDSRTFSLPPRRLHRKRNPRCRGRFLSWRGGARSIFNAGPAPGAERRSD